MAGRRYRRPPSLNLSFSSRESSPSSSKSSSPEPYSEDEFATTAPRTHRPYRPTSICGSSTTSSNPYASQPSLSDVLANTAPAPYTLSAFMAYLSQNHCLETLEFTMDAGRYRKHWKALTPPGCAPPSPDSEGSAYVRMLWQRLLDAYIVPNGPREVNLPCSVRDQILSAPNHTSPPPPEVLDPAVEIVHELMQESVLIPFVHECQHSGAYSLDHAPPLQPPSAPWATHQADENVYMRGSLDERLLRRKRDPSPPMPMDFVSHSYSTGDSRTRRAASPFSASLGWHRQSTHTTQSSWASGSGDSMVEDSGSSTPSFGTPMTPPTTPPTNEAMLPGSTGSSPKSRASEKGWKKMAGGLGRGFGWSKKKGSGVFNEGSF